MSKAKLAKAVIKYQNLALHLREVEYRVNGLLSELEVESDESESPFDFSIDDWHDQVGDSSFGNSPGELAVVAGEIIMSQIANSPDGVPEEDLRRIESLEMFEDDPDYGEFESEEG